MWMPNCSMGRELGSKVCTVGGEMPEGSRLVAAETRAEIWLAAASLLVSAGEVELNARIARRAVRADVGNALKSGHPLPRESGSPGCRPRQARRRGRRPLTTTTGMLMVGSWSTPSVAVDTKPKSTTAMKKPTAENVAPDRERDDGIDFCKQLRFEFAKGAITGLPCGPARSGWEQPP